MARLQVQQNPWEVIKVMGTNRKNRIGIGSKLILKTIEVCANFEPLKSRTNFEYLQLRNVMLAQLDT